MVVSNSTSNTKRPRYQITHAIITAETVQQSLVFLPFIPVGVWLGVWLNRKFSEQVFLKVVYGMTFLTGLQLICNFNLTKWLR